MASSHEVKSLSGHVGPKNQLNGVVRALVAVLGVEQLAEAGLGAGDGDEEDGVDAVHLALGDEGGAGAGHGRALLREEGVELGGVGGRRGRRRERQRAGQGGGQQHDERRHEDDVGSRAVDPLLHPWLLLPAGTNVKYSRAGAGRRPGVDAVPGGARRGDGAPGAEAVRRARSAPDAAAAGRMKHMTADLDRFACDDRFPGLEIVRLIRRAIESTRLDLKGLRVLTEASVGYRRVTPVIAALAGADEVYAVGRDTVAASRKEAEEQTAYFAELAHVGARVKLLSTRLQAPLETVDVVTDLPGVRPVDESIVRNVAETAAVTLMRGAAHWHAADVDVATCRRQRHRRRRRWTRRPSASTAMRRRP